MRGRQVFQSIHGLRAVAALLVVAYHATVMQLVAPFYPVHVGAFGVDIFFVISGFVMLSSCEGRRDIAAFWTARLVRIVPLYWIATLVFVLATVATPSLLITGRRFDAAEVVQSLLFFPAYNASVGAMVPTLTIGWSLNYEMFFYLVFGLALVLRGNIQRLAACGSVLILLVLLGQAATPGSAWHFYSRPVVLEFVAGMALACLRSEAAARIPRALALAAVAGAVVLFGAAAAAGNPTGLAGPAAVLLVGGLLRFEDALKAHPRPALSLLADASYAIYLFHPFFQRLVFLAFGGSIHTLPQAIAYSLLALLAGALGGVTMHLWLEKPLTRWLRGRVLARRPAGAG